MFHRVCIEQWLFTGNGHSKCPTCSKPFSCVTEVQQVDTTIFPSSIPETCHIQDTLLQQETREVTENSPFQATQNHVETAQSEATSTSHQTLPTNSHDYAYVNHQYGNIITMYISDDSDDEFLMQNRSPQKQAIPFLEKFSAFCNEKVKKDEEDSFIRLKVRRNAVWHDVKFKLGRMKKLMQNGFVKVDFIAESAVDDGGPKRELFNLINQEVLSSSLFVGEEHQGKAFAQNLSALTRKEYYTYGLCCGLGILNGAQGPQAFSPPVVQYILNEKLELVTCPVSCVPDATIKANLKEIESLTDANAYASAVFKSAACRSVEYDNSEITLEKKVSFLNIVATHHTVAKSLAEIHQFIDGLKIFGVLDLLRQYPVEAADLFQFKTRRLTAEKIDSIFQSTLSPEGSNRHEKEMAILFNWRQFLEDVEQGDVISTTSDPLQEQDVKINVSLSAVLAFVTGSPAIPPLGFSPEPRIVFDYEVLPRKLHVHTCSNEIHFPVAEDLLSYETFKDDFLFCMFNSPGFGMV